MHRNSLVAILAILTVIFGGLLYFKSEIGAVNIPQSAGFSAIATTTPQGLSGFTLPSGFSMHIFTKDVPDARVMALSPDGALLVSEPSLGVVVALLDEDGDGRGERKDTVISGLRRPHGLAFDCATEPCDLYIAEEDSVAVYDYNAQTRKAQSGKQIVELPDGGGHYTRSLLFMGVSDERTLLISVGSSCNVCIEKDAARAAILAYNTVTEDTTIFATGLRNSVFMTLHPVTGAVWATDMGRDSLGDDLPPEEINIIEKGKNYGWPYCYGKNIHDSNFDPQNKISCSGMAPSAVDMQAHSAPLGIAFIPEGPPAGGWPEEWWYDAVVAFHGSWNRSEPTGYKLVRIPLDAQGKSEGVIQDFVTGFMRPDGKTIGRPVDILIFPGGKMYISDDQAGVIYEVSRR
jgi:glucose/arabinose dehydrogenase